MTGGSSSVRAGLEQFREAGAAARAMLIAAAAQQWNVSPSTCRTESGGAERNESQSDVWASRSRAGQADAAGACSTSPRISW
ncbi:MAG TPA: hypothetical protein VNX26_04050 [Candidatus Acidoferrum sp.]|nr:hypothetical protein [Candidatus Acidoferrum sp.]